MTKHRGSTSNPLHRLLKRLWASHSKIISPQIVHCVLEPPTCLCMFFFFCHIDTKCTAQFFFSASTYTIIQPLSMQKHNTQNLARQDSQNETRKINIAIIKCTSSELMLTTVNINIYIYIKIIRKKNNIVNILSDVQIKVIFNKTYC